MANWGAGSVIALSANDITSTTSSSVETISDVFLLPQLPRKVNTSLLNEHSALNIAANTSVVLSDVYTTSTATGVELRPIITFSNAVRKQFVPYNRRPVSGQVYPR